MTPDKQWASKYLLDPLTAPEPSQETGPGTHYNSTFSPQPDYQPSARKHIAPKHVTRKSVNSRTGYPSPPASAGPHDERFPDHRQAVSSGFDNNNDDPLRRSSDRASTQIPTSTGGASSVKSRRRNNSLSSRFEGDQSHRPLDMIKRETKLANRAPYLRKKNQVGPDIVDGLDNVAGSYHHGGPFDPTLLARNTSFLSSPVEAVSASNAETLRATPREMIKDSIEKHRPLDGVAVIPPGMTDMSGRIYDYQEGTDMMRDNGGNYKRWPGVNYLPEDLKGKGEPSYSLEKALKEHKSHNRNKSDGSPGMELTHRPRPISSGAQVRPTSEGQKYSDWEADRGRNSSGRSVSGVLGKRFESLRKDRK